MSKVKKIEDIFPILSIDSNGLIVTKNADLAIVFEVDYPEIFLLTDQKYYNCFDKLMQGVKNLGEGFLLHKQDFFIEDFYTPDDSYNESNDFVIKQNELNFKDRPFTNHKAFIYLIYPSSNPLKRDSMASAIFRKQLTPKHITQDKTIKMFNEKVKTFQQTINQSKTIKLNVLDRDRITGTKEVCGLLNYYFSLSFKDNNLYDISIENNYFNVGGKFTSTFVINDLEQFPEEINPVLRYDDYSTETTTINVSTGLKFGLNLPFNHIYNQILYVPKQTDETTKLSAEINRHKSFSSVSQHNEYSEKNKKEFINALKSTLAVKAHFNIQVFHKSQETLDEYNDTVSATIQNAGFISKRATTYAEQLYWSCIPANSVELGIDNFATMLLDNAISLWNLESNYKESPFQKNGILLTDRFGNPRIVDLFFKPLQEKKIFNRNFTVVGPSGSGKSFSMNNMIFYLLKGGAHITIVDIGHSYKRLGQLLGAKYVEHSENNPISLNPFYIELSTLKDDNAEVILDFKKTIAQIILILFKDNSDSVAKTESVTIDTMVNRYYKFIYENNSTYKKGTPEYVRPCFNSFFDFAKNIFPKIFEDEGGRDKEEFDLTKFLYVLKPFYKGGEYDYLLNGKEDEDLSKHPFVIYELDNIKDHPILLPVVTLMITNTYVSKLFGVKGALKMLIIEEAWRAVSSDFFANFLLWAFKTARKHLGSIGVVTQEIDDLLKSNIIKDAIVQNTDIKLIFDLKKYVNEIDTVLSLFKIRANSIPQIFSINRGSLNPNRRKFNEVAVLLGEECKVYGIEVSKFGYSLFTTEGTETETIKTIAADNNMSLLEASMEYASKHLI